MAILAYFCSGNPFSLYHGKTAWKLLHPDIPDEINCERCGSVLQLSKFNSKWDIDDGYRRYLEEYEHAVQNSDYHPQLARARKLAPPV